jgi:CheY-like chemotaxis protein
LNYFQRPLTRGSLAALPVFITKDLVPDHVRYILHLDDEALILRIVGDALAQRGHLVRSATSLREADRLVQSERPALLICDLHLADGDGILAIKALRTRWPGLPVLLLTGSVGAARQASDFADWWTRSFPSLARSRT